MKKNTKAYSQEYFISLLKEYHSENYDFDKVVYTGAGRQIIVTCKKHGDFYTYASSFLNSEEFSGCQLCRDEKRMKLKKVKTPPKVLTAEESAYAILVKLCSKNHSDRYDYSKTVYTGTEEYMTVICPAHGPFEALVARHKRGHFPCPVCDRNRKKHGKLYADNEYRELSLRIQSKA